MLDPLFPASFRGVPFWVDKDEAPKGRRLVVHEFPHRDDPFVEDMGRSARRWSVTAYLASDSALADGRALLAACEAAGPGTLTLPWDGPMQARCNSAHASRAKDRQGYLAFQLQFVEAGASQALVTLSLGAQLVFDAVQTLAGALGAAAAPAGAEMTPASIDAARQAWQDIPAALEAALADSPVDATQSRALSRRLADDFAAIPSLVSRAGVDAALPERLAQSALALGDALDPEVAAQRFAQASEEFGGDSTPARVGRAVALAAEAEAIVRVAYRDRPQATRARGDWSARAARVRADWSGAALYEPYEATADLVARTQRWFAAAMTDLREVRALDLSRPLPAVLLAWRLYADPSRGDEIVARNGAPHPGYVGPRLVALAA